MTQGKSVVLVGFDVSNDTISVSVVEDALTERSGYAIIRGLPKRLSSATWKQIAVLAAKPESPTVP